MKILFDVEHPFAWAHGGAQVLVKKLMEHLPKLGVEVEPVRWWDEKQTGDIVQVFYWPNNTLNYAKLRNMKVVNYVFLDGYTSQGPLKIFIKKYYIKLFKGLFNSSATELGWNYQKISDAYIYPSEYDKKLGNYLFNADISKSYAILHGVDNKYLVSYDDKSKNKEKYLISISTIHERKNTVLLAKIGKKLGIPIVFLGKSYSEQDKYFKEFMGLVDNKSVIYKGYVDESEKIELLKRARGFILLSKSESGCIAVLEAFALKCPVFLPDLRWAKAIYEGYAKFGTLDNEEILCSQIQEYYENCNEPGKIFSVNSWENVSRQYLEVYKKVLGVKNESHV